MKQGMLIAISTILSMTLLASCAANPDQTVVISKNDGSFDAGVAESAPDSIEPGSTKIIDVIDSFASTDGTVQFHFDLHETLELGNMPIAEITPHYLTEEDAKRIANVLFENETFYEARPIFDVKYSLGDIEAYIDRWVPYTNIDALAELYGTQDTIFLNEIQDSVKFAIQVFQQMADKDVVTSDRELCNWKFKPESYYK